MFSLLNTFSFISCPQHFVRNEAAQLTSSINQSEFSATGGNFPLLRLLIRIKPAVHYVRRLRRLSAEFHPSRQLFADYKQKLRRKVKRIQLLRAHCARNGVYASLTAHRNNQLNTLKRSRNRVSAFPLAPMLNSAVRRFSEPSGRQP